MVYLLRHWVIKAYGVSDDVYTQTMDIFGLFFIAAFFDWQVVCLSGVIKSSGE
jgi:hypothetical protein